MLHENDGHGNGVNRWGRVPLWWIGALRGKPNAMLVAVCLACHADGEGKAWPSAEAIAAVTGIRRDRVFAALRELKAARIIAASQPSPRRPTTHWLNFTVPDVGTQDVGTHTTDGKGTEERVLGVPIARSGNRDQQQIKHSLSPRTREAALKSPAFEFCSWMLDEGLKAGVVPAHHDGDHFAWCYRHIEAAETIIATYGEDEGRLRAQRFIAGKLGRRIRRDFTPASLLAVWDWDEIKGAYDLPNDGKTIDDILEGREVAVTAKFDHRSFDEILAEGYA